MNYWQFAHTLIKKKALAYKEPQSAAAIRLFCFPNAGGSAALYHPWIGAFGSTIDICPIEYAGRGTRSAEAYHHALQSLVQSLHNDLAPYLTRPFAFFGHSMGALVAYELASAIRLSNKQQPQHLFVSAHRGADLLRRIDDSYILDDAALTERIRELGGTPQEALENNELMALVLPTIRADFGICDTYTYAKSPPLTCPITALGGWKDPWVDEDELAAWERHTSAEFTLRLFQGNHFYLQTQQRPLLHHIGSQLLSSHA